MRRSRRLGIALLTRLVLGVLPISAYGAEQTAPALNEAPVAANSSFPAWDDFTQELNQLGKKAIAKLPERLRNDPQVRQEVGRLLLEALAAKSIEAISADAC